MPKAISKRQKIAHEQAKLTQRATELVKQETKKSPIATELLYPLPSVYQELSMIDTTQTLSRQSIYAVLGRMTPYLIQRLVYESANQYNAPRDRIHATEVLLSRIMPALSAEQLSVDAKDLQSLVIVRSATASGTDDKP
jgi:hypothetical protein